MVQMKDFCMVLQTIISQIETQTRKKGTSLFNIFDIFMHHPEHFNSNIRSNKLIIFEEF